MQQSKIFTPVMWQLVLMGLLGFSGVLFIPLLIRLAPAEAMAEILVGQVAIYYLVLFVQYGFQWSGPAQLAKLDSTLAQIAFWRQSIKTKAFLLLIGLFTLSVAIAWQGSIYLFVFACLLMAFALNSNWFLQARRDFMTGVLAAFIGVIFAGLLLLGMWFIGSKTWLSPWLAILVLVLPQSLLGFGSWLAARREAAQIPVDEAYIPVQSPRVASLLRGDFPVVLSQILLLGSTTLGTVVVGWLADDATTTAYAATEKLFNLGATVIVGLYMAFYPRLAERFYKKTDTYVRAVWQLFAVIAVFGFIGLILIGLWGQALIGLYLGEDLAELVSPILLPLSFWLMLCVSQHVVTGHLVFADRRKAVLWVNLLILVVTVGVGSMAAQIAPIDWVYGMIAGQLVALALLVTLLQKPCRVAA